LIYYDARAVSYTELADKVAELMRTPSSSAARCRRICLPVLYGDECAEDLHDLATKLELSVEKVIEIHSSTEYMVYMMGFSPGFAYLGELPSQLTIPRKLVPARSVPANSIQVGGAQTAVSSMPMPSGWYVIGRTPLLMYDVRRLNPFLLEGGDLISFSPVLLAEFRELSLAAAAGELDLKWEWV